MSTSDITPAPPPSIWILATGTEILQGLYPDRNSPWLSGRLLELGWPVERHMAAPDAREPLAAAMADAAGRADLLITSGGLGPTGDDLNRSVASEIWSAPLVLHEPSLARIRERFERRGRPMPPGNEVQAMIPQGAIVLPNDEGTAPGFYLRPRPGGPRARLLALPGPPRELQPMFERAAVPLLLEDFGASRRPLRVVTLRTAGVPESVINARLADLFGADPRVNLALLATLGLVDIRLTLAGDERESDDLEARWRTLVRERVGERHVYGEGSTTLAEAVGRLLRERGQTLAVAESCTGGMLAAALTDVPGASDYFLEGFVTYANAAKTARLGVESAVIGQWGAVSPPTAEAMARGARAAAGATWAVALTGIAGPGGGTPEKPVGLVYLALAGPLPGGGDARVWRRTFPGSRADVRFQATQTALNLLRRALIGELPDE